VVSDPQEARRNLVTGATGLLGSHVAEQLVARGEHVRALVRPSSEVTFLRQLGVELVPGDLRDPASVRAAAAGVDVVYHCAARVGDWGRWADFQAQVIDATRNVVAACRSASVGRLLHVSSVAVYGHPPRRDRITEDEAPGQRLRFLDHYCRAKVRAEALVWGSGLDVTVVRPSWIYGPRDRNSLPRLANALRGRWVKIQGSGAEPLNLVHAADVAEGALRAAGEPAARGLAYHLCGEGEITQRQFLDVLSDALGLPRVQRSVSPTYAYLGGLLGDVIARVFRWDRPPFISRYSVGLLARPSNYSIERARQHLGWQPLVHPDKGLRQAVAWLLRQEALLAALPVSPIDPRSRVGSGPLEEGPEDPTRGANPGTSS
jgi:nucleoside-diphosphate-sugar epimerase